MEKRERYSLRVGNFWPSRWCWTSSFHQPWPLVMLAVGVQQQLEGHKFPTPALRNSFLFEQVRDTRGCRFLQIDTLSALDIHMQCYVHQSPECLPAKSGCANAVVQTLTLSPGWLTAWLGYRLHVSTPPIGDAVVISNVIGQGWPSH